MVLKISSSALQPQPPTPALSALSVSSFVNMTFHPLSRSQRGKWKEEIYKASPLASLWGTPFFISCDLSFMHDNKTKQHNSNNNKNHPDFQHILPLRMTCHPTRKPSSSAFCLHPHALAPECWLSQQRPDAPHLFSLVSLPPQGKGRTIVEPWWEPRP